MKGFVLALGYFDSIHIGHGKVIFSALSYAKERNKKLAVATFDDGFLRAIGRNEKEVFLLNERERILHGLGVEKIIVFSSEVSFLQQTKYDFCRYLEGLTPEAVFVGSDYRFGKNAEGDVDFLTKNCSFPVFSIEILTVEGRKVSSSDIRKKLLRSEMEQVNELLCVPYFLIGEVKKGRTVGRKMTFPTINLIPTADKALPKRGVYVTETEIDGKKYLSVTNVGDHPTFDDNVCNIETHVIDFNGDVYGKEVIVYFYRYLREIKKFSDMDELKRQITKDIFDAKEYNYDKIRRSGQQ